MELFKLNIDDIDAFQSDICEMLEQSFEKSFPNKTFMYSDFFNKTEKAKQYILDDKAIIHGIKDNDQLVGFVWFFRRVDSDKDIIHINHFVIHEKYRGFGLGRSLIDSVESYAKKHDIKEIELMVTKENKDTVSFYNNRNFEVERFVMKKRLVE